jgi:5,10-methenyltetrahydromethanopterin hydrogenase
LQDSLSTNITATNGFFTAIFKLIPPPPDGPDIHFTVAPNPSNGTFVLTHDNKTQATGCTYEIFDLSGRIITRGTVNNTALETPVSIPEMRSAVYILRVNKKEEVLSTVKVLKY